VLAAPEALVSSLHNALMSLQWTAPSFWAEVFELMRANGSAERCLTAHRREATRRLELYAEIVHDKPVASLPSYHVWQRVPASWRVDDFVAELLTVGVRVSPAQHFAIAHNTDNNFIRVCLGGSDDIDALKDQLARLSAVMRGRPRLSATII
jgi:DNA-binding transcriptional MocR family regulator